MVGIQEKGKFKKASYLSLFVLTKSLFPLKLGTPRLHNIYRPSPTVFPAWSAGTHAG